MTVRASDSTAAPINQVATYLNCNFRLTKPLLRACACAFSGNWALNRFFGNYRITQSARRNHTENKNKKTKNDWKKRRKSTFWINYRFELRFKGRIDRKPSVKMCELVLCISIICPWLLLVCMVLFAMTILWNPNELFVKVRTKTVTGFNWTKIFSFLFLALYKWITTKY